MKMRRFTFCLILSLMIHSFAIHLAPPTLQRSPVSPPPLTATLQPLQPRTVVAPPRPIPKTRQNAAPAASPPYEPVVASPAVSSPDTPPSEAILGPQGEPFAAPAAPSEKPLTTLPDPSPREGAPLAPPETKIARTLAPKGEIISELFYGKQRLSIGETVQQWEVQDARYRINSFSRTTGLFSVIRGDRLSYESVGAYTEAGLRPQLFIAKRELRRRNDEFMARFDWINLKVSIDAPPRFVDLPPKTQDLLSFMFQLGLVPLRTGRIELPVTNGRKLELYQLDVGVDQELQTLMGTLQVIPIKQVREAGKEHVELYLARDYQLLPVRIIFFDGEGEMTGEQLVTSIRVEAPR